MGELDFQRKINDITLSAVSLGTMRWIDKGLSEKEVIDLILFLYHEVGINTHHSSYEYSSYELYCNALKEVKKDKSVQLNHICKLSAPDFKETEFSKTILRKKILSELQHLQADRIDVLQWLYRTEPIEDVNRIPALINAKEEIEAAFSEFIKEGIVGVAGTFPYTAAFGKTVSELIPSNTGWVTYFNLTEREYIDNLPEDQWMIGIRPFYAGKLVSQSDGTDKELTNSEFFLKSALQFCFSHAIVKSNILSVNSITQAKSLQAILQQLYSTKQTINN